MQKLICKEYVDFVRKRPCLVCGKRPVDADHLIARGRGSAKQIDFFCIPLDREHHSERHQIGDEKFQAKYRLNLWRCAAEMLCEFFLARGPTAYIFEGKNESQCSNRTVKNSH